MRKQIAIIFLISIPFLSFSQNKKKQIEEMNLLIDSCRTIMSNLTSDLELKQIRISELEQSLFEEKIKSEEKSEQITLLKKNIDSLTLEIGSLKNSLPAKAYFKFKTLNKVENQDARFGTDSELEISLIIENQLIDKYTDYGDTSLLNLSKTEFYLNSEMSEKIYAVLSISPTKVIVTRIFYCFDCEIQESVIMKIYEKDSSGVWKYQSCGGCGDMWPEDE